METAAIVLGLAALGGVTLAGIRLSGTPQPPTWMALGHGAIAVTGLVLLANAVGSPSVPSLAQAAMWIFVLAALGGATLFLGFHLRGKALPIPLVIGHGLAAATGYLVLLVTLFRNP